MWPEGGNGILGRKCDIIYCYDFHVKIIIPKKDSYFS